METGHGRPDNRPIKAAEIEARGVQLAMLQMIEASLTRDFGERCLDYAAGCAGCRAWRAYDDLSYLYGAD